METPARFEKPLNWCWGSVTPRNGQSLRFGWVAPAQAKGLCVIFPGLSEYCEKYFEVAHDLLDRGFAVACIDWRGQGLSWRHLEDHDKRHHDDFAYDTQDASAYLAALSAIPALAALPRVALGHSMGGHIALRTLHGARDAFRCAVLTAPMFGINLPVLTEGPARLTAEAACRMGWADHYVFGAGKWSMSVFTNNLNLLTSDGMRRAVVKKHMAETPALRMGGLTFGWVRAALASTRLTADPKWLAGIHTPTLVMLSGREMIVSNHAATEGVRHLPGGKLVHIEGALHEIMMEAPEYRNRFWTEFDGFVANHIAPR